MLPPVGRYNAFYMFVYLIFKNSKDISCKISWGFLFFLAMLITKIFLPACLEFLIFSIL